MLHREGSGHSSPSFLSAELSREEIDRLETPPMTPWEGFVDVGVENAYSAPADTSKGEGLEAVHGSTPGHAGLGEEGDHPGILDGARSGLGPDTSGHEFVQGADSGSMGHSHRFAGSFDFTVGHPSRSDSERDSPVPRLATANLSPDVHIVRDTKSGGGVTVFTRRGGTGVPRERIKPHEETVTTKQVRGWTRIMVTERPREYKGDRGDHIVPISPRNSLGAATRWGLLPSRLRLGAPHGLAAVERDFEAVLDSPPRHHHGSITAPTSQWQESPRGQTAGQRRGSLTAREGGKWGDKGGNNSPALAGANPLERYKRVRGHDSTQLQAAREQIEQMAREQGNDLVLGRFPYPLGSRWGSRAQASVPTPLFDRKHFYDATGENGKLKRALGRRHGSESLKPPVPPADGDAQMRDAMRTKEWMHSPMAEEDFRRLKSASLLYQM